MKPLHSPKDNEHSDFDYEDKEVLKSSEMHWVKADAASEKLAVVEIVVVVVAVIVVAAD